MGTENITTKSYGINYGKYCVFENLAAFVNQSEVVS